MTIYYSSLEKYSKQFYQERPSCSFQGETLLEFSHWKKCTRTKLRNLIGLNRMKSCKLEPEIISVEELKDSPYRRKKMRIQTEEGIWMPFYILEPKLGISDKMPVMIALHGHGSGGKLATAGCTQFPEVQEVIERQNYTYGVEFAKKGYMVFCPDARGFGERREVRMQGDNPEQYMGCSCRELSHMASGLGITVTGMWVWDLIRLLDYIETLEACDYSHIGCVGLSGGGMQALWLSALDDRISFSTVSGYFYGYHDSLLVMNQNCECNYVPGLWKVADMGDIGALIAPRPFVIESGLQDHLIGPRGIDNVMPQVSITRNAYELFHAESALVHDIFDGPHKFHGEKSYAMAKKHLGL